MAYIHSNQSYERPIRSYIDLHDNEPRRTVRLMSASCPRISAAPSLADQKHYLLTPSKFCFYGTYHNTMLFRFHLYIMTVFFIGEGVWRCGLFQFDIATGHFHERCCE
jgi:hypothetical protein